MSRGDWREPIFEDGTGGQGLGPVCINVFISSPFSLWAGQGNGYWLSATGRCCKKNFAFPRGDVGGALSLGTGRLRVNSSYLPTPKGLAGRRNLLITTNHFQGFTIRTPVSSKCFTFLVTTVRSWTSAVAAIKISGRSRLGSWASFAATWQISEPIGIRRARN